MRCRRLSCQWLNPLLTEVPSHELTASEVVPDLNVKITWRGFHCRLEDPLQEIATCSSVLCLARIRKEMNLCAPLAVSDAATDASSMRCRPKENTIERYVLRRALQTRISEPIGTLTELRHVRSHMLWMYRFGRRRKIDGSKLGQRTEQRKKRRMNRKEVKGCNCFMLIHALPLIANRYTEWDGTLYKTIWTFILCFIQISFWANFASS